MSQLFKSNFANNYGTLFTLKVLLLIILVSLAMFIPFNLLLDSLL